MKTALALSFLLSALASSTLVSLNALSENINSLSIQDHYPCLIAIKINDLAELNDFPKVAGTITPLKEDPDFKYHFTFTTSLTKSELLEVMDLSYVVSLEVLTPKHIPKAQ